MKAILVNQSRRRMPRKFLERWVRRVERSLPRQGVRNSLKGKELVIVFLDPAPARKLNCRYRNRNYATDVLSFEGVEINSLGELVICPQVVERQARDHGLSFQYELAYLVLHGVLHLLGFEHEGKPREAARMFNIQDKIFSEIDKLG